MDLLERIQSRKSFRARLETRPVPREELLRVLEAARWSPSAHNMQNWEIVVVDDPDLLEALEKADRPVSEAFVRENYQQLSFCKEELLRRKTGLMASMFPVAWQKPDFKADALEESGLSSPQPQMRLGPVLLVVLYDPRRRAPASEGDFLGVISLGCLMENLWLEAEALGLGVRIVSGLEDAQGLKDTLGIPEHLRVAFSVRLGYPAREPTGYLRVRRNVEDFTYYNQYGTKK